MRNKAVLWGAIGAAMLSVANRGFTQNEPPNAGTVAQTLVGKTFYACKGGVQRVDGHPMLDSDVLSTDPLRVTSARVSNPTKYPGARVTLTLREGNGAPIFETMAFVDVDDLTDQRITSAVMRDAHLQLEPPDGGNRIPEKGMTQSMLFCVFGPPESVNDYDGETQLVYDHGSLLIYLDSDHRVAAIQKFGGL